MALIRATEIVVNDILDILMTPMPNSLQQVFIDKT